MDRGTVARIEGWETAPFSGGFDGLRDLAGSDFSGAVSAAGAWLFMLNGRVIGVPAGTIDAFEGTDGTAYRAPHPSLPLLFAMRERGGETRAKYYTDDTPLNEVDRTLSQGGFTGYVELSENVLSGDYYVLYYGGQSLSAAFVGTEERLLTGEEAFERANDEVGIYEVRTVELDVRDVPEASGASGASPSVAPDATADDASSGASDPGGAPRSEPASGAGTDPEPPAADTDSATPEDSTGPDSAGARSPSEVGEPVAQEGTEPSAREVDSAPDRDETGGSAHTGDAGSAAPTSGRAEGETTRAQRTDVEDPFSEEEEWREARTIPALDPDESTAPGQERTTAPEPERSTEGSPNAEGNRAGREADTDGERETRAAVEAAEDRIADLEDRLEDATGERDALREERDRLRRRVADLEAGSEEAVDAGERLDPTEALAGSDVFVRYGSKGRATLESARDGDDDRDAVNENLRLETHTRFDEESVIVDGRPFEDFLTDSLEHQFVRWIVEELLYEIRDTGSVGGLRDLYDALPRIDRIEFRGSITTRDADGEERSESFDVVLRDRMGSPLAVADLNDARDPATSEMMSDLLERATAIAEEQGSLAGAFLVTASFFEPDALETASEATDVGLLNRDARKSFVKLSRKRGYHLCLVEARGDEFHVAVPEL